MEFNNSQTLYQASRNIDTRLLPSADDKYLLCCCISEKWCFEHRGIAGNKMSNKNINNFCLCLDCCSWCLEFKMDKKICCNKDVICYLGCCAIYFT